MTDEELMLAVCKGDQLAYQTVVKTHLAAISHYAFRMLGNSKDTEDIAQETFLKLWINAPTWKAEKSKLSTWLHRITHNLCVDHLRKHSRLQTQDSFDDSGNNDAAKSQEDLDEDTRKMKLLNSALRQLPESQRSAITLCSIQNFSNKEAADIMNLSVKALESTVARGKRSLKKIIQSSDEHTNDLAKMEKVDP